jgi:hypothetical protein
MSSWLYASLIHQLLYVAALLYVSDAYDHTCRTCTSSTTCAVQVILVIARHIDVQHKVDVVNVNSSSCNVGCNKNRNIAFFKILQSFISSALALATVKCISFYAHCV